MKIGRIPIEVIIESFKSKSEVSSTRVMSYLTWRFTKWWMILFGGVFLAIFTLDAFGKLNVNQETMGGMISFYTWSVITLLVATFTPKTLSQIADTFPKMKFFNSDEKNKTP